MTISYNTGTTFSANTSATAEFTIPSGVNPGDQMQLGFAVLCESNSAPSISFSGGGGSWTLPTPLHDGSNPEQIASGGVLYCYGYYYTRVAASGDPGAAITLTETGSVAGTTWWAGVLGAYPGAAAVQPDVAGSKGVNDATTGTSPSETTAVSGDWAIGFLLGGTGATGTPAAPSALTTRESVKSSAGVCAILADSNGSVGASGTSIGDQAWTGGNSAPNNTWTVWTIGLAPGGTPHTATASLAVAPTFSAARTRGHYRTGALPVSPSFSAARTAGRYRHASLIVVPAFSAAGRKPQAANTAFYSTPGAMRPGAIWPGDPLPAVTPPVFTYPALWSVEWVQAETQVTVTGLGVQVSFAPAGPLAATVGVTSLGQSSATFEPPDTEVIYPAPAAVIQPPE